MAAFVNMQRPADRQISSDSIPIWLGGKASSASSTIEAPAVDAPAQVLLPASAEMLLPASAEALLPASAEALLPASAEAVVTPAPAAAVAEGLEPGSRYGNP